MSAKPDRWIVIPKWEEFQHYHDGREPFWIKTYLKLLRKDEYLSLTAPQRAVLHGLWLLAAEGKNRGSVLEDTSKISRRLGLRVRKDTLEALNHAGFVELSSRPRLYTETEKEKERTTAVRETER